MSSHDCYIQGEINLRPNISKETVIEAFSDFLEEKSIEIDPNDRYSNNRIDIEGGKVSFFLDFCAMGAEFRDDDCENLAESLGEISDGPNYIEFVDTDCSSSEGNKQIYTIGSENDKKQAQLQFAASRFADWASGVLDKSVLEAAKQYLMSLPTRPVA